MLYPHVNHEKTWSGLAGTLLHWLCWELQSWTGTTGSTFSAFYFALGITCGFQASLNHLTARVPRWPAFPASCGKELFAWTGSGTKRADQNFRRKHRWMILWGELCWFDEVSITESQQGFKAWGSTNEWHGWKWVGLVGNIPAIVAIDGEHFMV